MLFWCRRSVGVSLLFELSDSMNCLMQHLLQPDISLKLILIDPIGLVAGLLCAYIYSLYLFRFACPIRLLCLFVLVIQGTQNQGPGRFSIQVLGLWPDFSWSDLDVLVCFVGNCLWESLSWELSEIIMNFN